jgi:hypothetical protein
VYCPRRLLRRCDAKVAVDLLDRRVGGGYGSVLFHQSRSRHLARRLQPAEILDCLVGLADVV